MNSTEIKALIDKCIGSESSLSEQQQLLDLFTSGDYPPEFETEAIIFRYLVWEASERKRNPEFERELKLRENSIPVMLPRHRKFRTATAWLAVATVLLLGGLTFTFRHTYLSGEEQATILHNRTEYKKFCMTMNMISSGMSSGNSKTKKIDKLHPASLSLDRNNELQ